jgi:hypothetical protein
MDQVAMMKRMAVRSLLTPVYALAVLGTAPAYLHFVAGSIAGFDGITKGRYFLGPVLSLLCVLAAFALWRTWSIGGRLWRYGAYINASPKDRSYDAAGLAAASAAFIGFVAIAKAIHRADEVIVFSVLLVPAACLASIAFLRSKSVNGSADGVRSAATLKLVDLPGLVCGTAVGLLGIYYLVPVPISGWGACDWTVFYPLYPDLWPVRRLEVFDACSNDVWTLTVISGVPSLVCLVAGTLAAAIGRNANAERGALAAAIVVAFVLVRLAVQMSDTPTAPHIGWVHSLIAGVLIVLGAAWLGYVGGKRGVEWSRRLHGSKVLAAD